MRSSAPEGQHAPRAKQAPPSGSSGATAGPAGATPPSPHATNSSSPRPQSSTANLPSHKASPQPQPPPARASTAALTPQNRVAPQSRGVTSHPVLQRSQPRGSSLGQAQPQPQSPQQQRSPPNSSPLAPPAQAGNKPLTPHPKGIPQRLGQPHQQKTSPQALPKSQPSFGAQQQQQQPAQQGTPPGTKAPASKPLTAPNPPNFGEYDDQEWDVGVGHLIIDLDADIAQADRGRMSGSVTPSGGNHTHQGTPGNPGSEDKHSLKMKIKRTKPPTKTSEAKHEIVKPDGLSNTGGAAVVMVTGAAPSTPQHNGPSLKAEASSTPRGPAVTPRTIYKKEKRRIDVNGTTSSPPPPVSGASLTPRSIPLDGTPTRTPVLPHSTPASPVLHTTSVNSTHVTVTPLPSSSQGVTVGPMLTSTGPHHFPSVRSEGPGPHVSASATSARLPSSALPQGSNQAPTHLPTQPQPQGPSTGGGSGGTTQNHVDAPATQQPPTPTQQPPTPTQATPSLPQPNHHHNHNQPPQQTQPPQQLPPPHPQPPPQQLPQPPPTQPPPPPAPPQQSPQPPPQQQQAQSQLQSSLPPSSQQQQMSSLPQPPPQQAQSQPKAQQQQQQQQQTADISSPAAKRQKLSEDGSKRDVCIGTSVATITEPDCLGPCEPGSSVTLEGIVWHETEGGVLVVNVTWRGKTYVGTLLDCTKHDWAPPRFCDSPTSDLESRTPKGRAKRGRAAAASSSSSSSTTSANTSNSAATSATTAHTPTTEMNVTETRSGKLRNASVKGRRGAATPNFNPPPSPVKVEMTGTKRKGREGDTGLQPDPKLAKKARSTSRGTPPTNGCSSPGPEQPPPPSQSQPHTQSQGQSQQQPQAPSETPPPPPPQPASSPQLIECPEPNCSKKYKHINGLKYHQSHAHNNSQSTNEDESTTTAENRGESSEVEEIKQPSPPSPTPLASTPADSSSQEIVKPAVLRPSAPLSTEKADVANGPTPQPVILPHQTNPTTTAKSPQHLYVYPNTLGPGGIQKQSVSVASTVRLAGNPSSTISPVQDVQGTHSQTPNLENGSCQPSPSVDQPSQNQCNVVVLTSIPTSHPLILAQPKTSSNQHLQPHVPTHPSPQQNIQVTHSHLPPPQAQTNTQQLQTSSSLQQNHTQPLHLQQQQLTQTPPSQQPPSIQSQPPPPQHQSHQHNQPPPTSQPHSQQITQLPTPQQQLQPLTHHPLQQQQPSQPPPLTLTTHAVTLSVPLQPQISISSHYSVHSTQQQQSAHGLQQPKQQPTTPQSQQQQLQQSHSQQMQSQQGPQPHLKPQLQPNQPQQTLKVQLQSTQAPPNLPPPQAHHPSTVYHPQFHEQGIPAQQIPQQMQPRLEIKQDLISRMTPVHSATQLIPSSRPSGICTLADSSSTPPSNVISTAAGLSVTPIPQGTPLSSLPGSTVTSLRMKCTVEGDKTGGKAKEMVNGLPPKKEEEMVGREDARSPAYSDISDANDTAPVIDEDVESKDFKDEKKPELPIGGTPPYAYGLYFGGYGQPPHPYLMASLQHPQGLPLKPVDTKDLKEKAQEKDKKDFLTLPGGSDYMKFPPQYMYSYSHIYPPGYPDPYMRDPLYKDIIEKPKAEVEECSSNLEENDKGPTDLSRNAAAHPVPNNNVADKGLLNHKESKVSEGSTSMKEFDGRNQAPQDKRQMDPSLAYRYMNAYDARLPLISSPIEKPFESKPPPGVVKPSTPVPLSSPHLGSTPPANSSNGLSKEEKMEKRLEVKSEGVKPTMETTGPPPPPTSSAYYPPFPYAHVPFDPYRPPMVPGMSLAAGFPPYLTAPPPTLGGLRYQIGVPNGPEDLSPSGAGAAILTSGLYPGSHKIAELQERAQKSPSGQVVSSGSLVMNRGGSPLTLITGNPLSGAPPHNLSHMVSSPSFSSSSPASFTSSIAVQQGSLMSSGHLGERKTPPLGPRLPSHPSLPEGYPYSFLPAQFPPHFSALGMNPTVLPSVGVGGPGVPPSGMGGGPPPPK